MRAVGQRNKHSRHGVCPFIEHRVEAKPMQTQGSNDTKDTNAQPWTAAELQHFEKRLMDERKRAVAQVAEFDDMNSVSEEEATGELTTWRLHMADLGTETFEREQNFLLASREGRLLYHIDEALRRLYRSPETFGHCAECGKKLAFERLDAIPYVPRCVHCKQDWEGSLRATGAAAPAPTPDEMRS